MSAETAMFHTQAAADRIAECVADALDDREMLTRWWAEGVVMLAKMHEHHITLCANGCGVDFQDIIDGFEPDSPDIVAARARELAADRERW